MDTKKARVLLVDDDPFVTNLITRHFETEGIEHIIIARNTSECMAALSGCDIVILDYLLVEENGIDILRQIKSKSPDTPVIFLSGQEYITVAIRSLKYGAFDYLEKSKMNFDRLVEVMASALEYRDTYLKTKRTDNFRRFLSFGIL